MSAPFAAPRGAALWEVAKRVEGMHVSAETSVLLIQIAGACVFQIIARNTAGGNCARGVGPSWLNF